jgi:SAM-dependent methyltransferase
MDEAGSRELLLGNHGNYFFDRNADDRRRLDHVFHTMRDDFDLWFDQALRLGGLSGDPERAEWAVLDVGCGEGQYALHVLERYPKAGVVGVDVNEDAIAAARHVAAGRPNARFAVHDMRDPLPAELRRPGGYEVAVGWLFLYFMPDARRTLADIAGALAPGGVALFCNVPEDCINHPDPDVRELGTALHEAARRVGMFEVERRVEDWLGELRFEGVRTAALRYPLGGATAHGQRWRAVILGVLAGGRRAIVDVCRLMPAREFDEKLERASRRWFVDDPGEARFVVTLARRSRHGETA